MARSGFDAKLLGLAALVLAWGVTGHLVIAGQPAARLEEMGRVRIYSTGIASLWLLFGYAAARLDRQGLSVRTLIDPLPLTARRLGTYALVAVGMLFAWGLISGILGLFLRPDRAQVQNLLALFPRGPVEKAFWIIMSLSAAFCEEFVYRGYVQTAVQRASGSLVIAIVVQALAYGFAHAALPWNVMVTVTFLGIFFGGVAAWRATLVPGMIMHAAFDLLAVFARK